MGVDRVSARLHVVAVAYMIPRRRGCRARSVRNAALSVSPRRCYEMHPQNRRLGYGRFSTYGQTLDAQLEQLRAEGCAKIYREKASGAQVDRRELLRML